MSGGEQQMLAIGRALMADPKLLLLDEPSMGLAPILVERIYETVAEINKQGTTILLVEQNANFALEVSDPRLRAGDGPRRGHRRLGQAAREPRGPGRVPGGRVTAATATAGQPGRRRARAARRRLWRPTLHVPPLPADRRACTASGGSSWRAARWPRSSTAEPSAGDRAARGDRPLIPLVSAFVWYRTLTDINKLRDEGRRSRGQPVGLGRGAGARRSRCIYVLPEVLGPRPRRVQRRHARDHPRGRLRRCSRPSSWSSAT